MLIYCVCSWCRSRNYPDRWTPFVGGYFHLPQPGRGTEWMRNIWYWCSSFQYRCFYSTAQTSQKKVSNWPWWLSISQLIPASCVCSANDQHNINSVTMVYEIITGLSRSRLCVKSCHPAWSLQVPVYMLLKKNGAFLCWIISFMVQFYHVDSTSLCSHSHLNRC